MVPYYLDSSFLNRSVYFHLASAKLEWLHRTREDKGTSKGTTLTVSVLGNACVLGVAARLHLVHAAS
jgi:hypothetical protein